MSSKTRIGKAFLKLDVGDKPQLILHVSDKEQALALLTKNGYLIIIGTNSVKELHAGGRGVQLIGLRPGDSIRTACLVGEAGLVFSAVTKKGQKKDFRLNRNKLLEFIGKRSQRGKMVNAKFIIESMK